MDAQRDVIDMGGTMRLGAYVAELAPGSQVAEAYGEPVVSERHRHRYEFNPRYRKPLRGRAASCCSGMSPDGRLVEFIELAGHPFWVGTQAHPEFKSRPDRPAPAVPGVRRRRARCGPSRTRPPHPLRRCRSRSTLGWREPAGSACVDEREVHAGPHLDASWSATFEAPDGEPFERDVVRQPGAVAVVPLLSTPRAARSWCSCASTGPRSTASCSRSRPGMRDVDGEDPPRRPRRELAEEVGLGRRSPGAAGRVPQLRRA